MPNVCETSVVNCKRQTLIYGSLAAAGLFAALIAYKFSMRAEDGIIEEEFDAVTQDRTSAFVIATSGLLSSM